MAQDLREILKKRKKNEGFQMKEGHENRFLERIEEELPQARKANFLWLKIAASLLVLVSSAFMLLKDKQNPSIPNTTVVAVESTEINKISLGDLSPDLKNIENYYLASINMELSKLEISSENKAMVDSFMERLEELNTEYQKLNTELNQIGPNDQTISALIKNLQLRLQLLQKLKMKLNEVKQSKNEQSTNII